MPTLILTVGLPRAGKGTWAKTTGLPIVNPDSIRLSLHGMPHFPPAEPMVWAVAKLMVRSLFKAGHNRVILDACSHTEYRRKEWMDAEWICRYRCFDTPKIECLKRALENKQEYLLPVIEGMSKSLTWPHADAEYRGENE